jgi:hypothetical protein
LTVPGFRDPTATTAIELAGALSEPREQARWERLVRRLAESPAERRLRQSTGRSPGVGAQGWVWPAIRRVLAAADEPMRPVAIYAAVVEDLDTAVSKSTVKNELRRRLAMEPRELAQNDASAYYLLRHSI